MTVVDEKQVKTIAADILEEFDGDHVCADCVEDVVRSVIAQYDISDIARLVMPIEVPSETEWKAHP